MALCQRIAIMHCPAGKLPRGRFHAAFRTVFCLEAVLENLELKWSDSTEKWHTLDGIRKLKLLGDPLLEQLVEAFTEALEFGGA